MWSGLNNCAKARRVKGNIGVRVIPNGRRACKANTIFIFFPTKIIPRVILLVSNSCNQSQRTSTEPDKPEAKAASATTERPPGEGEAAGMCPGGTGAGAAAGGGPLTSLRFSSVSKGN
jgi:hypothetical protein